MRPRLPGRCQGCFRDVEDRLLVNIIEKGSGPSGSILYCLPCARIYAGSGLCPDWLPADLRAYDAEQATR